MEAALEETSGPASQLETDQHVVNVAALLFRDACLVRAMNKIHQHYIDCGFSV